MSVTEKKYLNKVCAKCSVYYAGHDARLASCCDCRGSAQEAIEKAERERDEAIDAIARNTGDRTKHVDKRVASTIIVGVDTIGLANHRATAAHIKRTCTRVENLNPVIDEALNQAIGKNSRIPSAKIVNQDAIVGRNSRVGATEHG